MTTAESFPPNPSDVDTPHLIARLARVVGDDVTWTFRIGLPVVNGRRDHASRHGQGEDGGFDSARRAEAVAQHRFHRGHRDPVARGRQRAFDSRASPRDRSAVWRCRAR